MFIDKGRERERERERERAPGSSFQTVKRATVGLTFLKERDSVSDGGRCQEAKPVHFPHCLGAVSTVPLSCIQGLTFSFAPAHMSA